MIPSFTRLEVLRVLPQEAVPLVEAIVSCARENKLNVYLVGGPVRDLLLARSIRDVDLMVEPKGEVGAAELARLAAPKGVKVTSHERFGTASLETADAGVDLANLRSEVYAKPGALPRVDRGTLDDDLRRRDFSINALALPISKGGQNARVEVIDRVDGLAALEARELRIIHPNSFHDDPTRALRAARFAPRLKFSLSRSSRSALRGALRDGAFGAVSGDRLRREINRCFEDAHEGLNPAQALRLLSSWHVLGSLEPGLELPRESAAPLGRLGRIIADPAWPGPRTRPGVSGLALWLAPLSLALRRRTLERFSIRGELAMRITNFPKTRDNLLKRLAACRGRGAVDGILTGLDEDLLSALYVSTPTALRRRIARWAAEDRSRKVPVSGADLVELGLSGPAVGKALVRIRSGYLDGVLANREEALALAREMARPKARGSHSGRARR